ncbi:hypothetical protein [Halarchaeum sp. P4]|uniref:hypothetical protein n=1 Tax=Halarchaeum sp. P4 TaxID=3421639 RepID=UPI003EB7AAEC
MARTVLLTCPVCGAMRALVGDLDTHDRSALGDVVVDHLDAHRLGESARALRKHEAVSTAEERIVGDGELDALPTEEWLAALPTEARGPTQSR